MSLERALAHFRNHQEKFSEEHYRQFVLIHDEEVEGFYDDEMSAYMAGQKKFKLGSFRAYPVVTHTHYMYGVASSGPGGGQSGDGCLAA